jgi:hypothetical protein
MVFFFLWVAASFAVGSMAPARNRSYVDWTVLSLLISPLLAVLCLIAAGAKPARVIQRAPMRDPLAAMTGPASTVGPSPSATGSKTAAGSSATAAGACLPPRPHPAGPWGVSRVVGGPPDAQPQLVLQSMRGPLVIVPAPNPASRGILLDAWARSHAPLVPLN